MDPSAFTHFSTPLSTHASTVSSFDIDHDLLHQVDLLYDFDFSVDFTLFGPDDGPSFPLLAPDDGLGFPPFGPLDDPVADLDALPGLTIFPPLDGVGVDGRLPSMAPASAAHQHRCDACPASFRRACELTRHRLRHTTPFKCGHAGCRATFAERRRCRQHEKVAHGTATAADMRHCPLCDYASIRPDAVKRHVRLKHGQDVSFKPRSPPGSTTSTTSPSAR